MKAVDRLLALVAGLALAGVGGLVALETGFLSADQPAVVVPRSRWDRGMGDLEWSSTSLRVAAIILVASGALLLVLQLVRRSPRRLALDGGPGRTAWITPASVRRVVERAVIDDNDEVRSARARVGRRRVRIQAEVVAGSDDATPRRVATSVEEAVGALEMHRSPRVRVRLQRNDGRRVR